MDWSKPATPPEKISIGQIINNFERSRQQEKERQEYERLEAQLEKEQARIKKEQGRIERIRARKEYLVNKYGEKFSLDELEEFERVFQTNLDQEREKEMKRLKKMEEEERQLQRDMYR
jgi:hypothetical protein